MVTDYVRRIVDLMGGPPVRKSREDWAGVRAGLGVDLPTDFVELVSVFGAAQFDGFLITFAPTPLNSGFDLVRAVAEQDEAYEVLWAEGEDKPESIRPEDRLIVWATTDNGDYFSWRVSPGVPSEEWPTMLNESRGSTWYEYSMTSAELLYRLFIGDIEVDIFNGHLPKLEHGVALYGDKVID